jgi:hypothetical protein
MKKKLSILFMGCMLAFAACGDDADETPPTPTPEPADIVDLSGTLAWHPVSATVNAGAVALGGAALTWGDTGDITWGLVAALEAVTLEPGETPTFLATGTIDPSKELAQGGCSDNDTYGSVCAWSATDVDITSVSLGLIMLIQDGRTTALFETTNMGMASSTSIAAWKASGEGAADLTALVVSKESAMALAPLTGLGDATTAYPALLERGYMFGMTVTSDLKPVGGVTVNVGDFSGVTHTVTYPAPDMETGGIANTPGTATGIKLGFFIYHPSLGTTVNTNWQACQGTGAVGEDFACVDSDTDYTWNAVAAAGTQPGTVFVLTYLANETCDGTKPSTLDDYAVCGN